MSSSEVTWQPHHSTYKGYSDYVQVGLRGSHALWIPGPAANRRLPLAGARLIHTPLRACGRRGRPPYSPAFAPFVATAAQPQPDRHLRHDPAASHIPSWEAGGGACVPQTGFGVRGGVAVVHARSFVAVMAVAVREEREWRAGVSRFVWRLGIGDGV